MILDPPTADVGAVYAGRVVNLTKFGAFVNILPGRDGLLHISKLSALAGGKRVNAVEDVLTLGQPLEVRVDDIDPQGKVSLSLAGEVAPVASAGAGRDDRPAREDRPARDAGPSPRVLRGARVELVGSRVRRRDEDRVVRGVLRGPAPSRAGRPRPGEPAHLRRRRLPAPEEQPPPQVAAAVPAATKAVLERLDNGCRLVTERVVGARSASLGVFVTVGSRHEPAAVAGASHFLEHLLFKGTDQLDAATIAESLDRVGGQSNAYTARELTCFWVRLLGEDLDVGLSRSSVTS